jgi:hypothetical protein
MASLVLITVHTIRKSQGGLAGLRQKPRTDGESTLLSLRRMVDYKSQPSAEAGELATCNERITPPPGKPM